MSSAFLISHPPAFTLNALNINKTSSSSLSISSASLITNRSYTGATYGIGGHLAISGGLIESTHNGILFGISSTTAISGGTFNLVQSNRSGQVTGQRRL
ncbi:MAG TPA: hypothetical protein PKI59_00750 [Candidatus Cloacimonadota bacterium]|jgi:hypothetical protein|nr:hypothetical protein [Candidatus Cloacimonadota bacterium]